ncbi:hypothetical protein KIN20_015816 [Parelaphostrongylus tenuis]|uniref:Uncharacterized protein n=1 Tax=Parelaphostrongylus tenuis TaxID=148309 RepID=A0AAD5N1A3_PARTN|nr:hypothetical protein KIN20_015816 [Parelaphostrongylus tenuis]
MEGVAGTRSNHSAIDGMAGMTGRSRIKYDPVFEQCTISTNLIQIDNEHQHSIDYRLRTTVEETASVKKRNLTDCEQV